MNSKLIICILCFCLYIGYTRGCFNPEEALKNKHDIPRKVITKFPKTKIYDIKNRNRIIEEVDLFKFFYIYPQEKDGYYPIGKETSQNKPDGWISKSKVVEWDNREAICLEYVENAEENQLVSFYSNTRDLLADKNSIFKEELFITPNFSNIIMELSTDTRRKFNQLDFINNELSEKLFKNQLKDFFGNDFNKYWARIIDISTRTAKSYSCQILYTRDSIPMPALDKYVYNDKTYYKVAFLKKDENSNKGFYEGWLKIPENRAYSVKVYTKRLEIEKELNKLNQLYITLGEEVTKNDDPSKSLRHNIHYIKRLLGILTGEDIESQKDMSLYEILLGLPKASKAEELIIRDKEEKCKKIENAIKKLKELNNNLLETGSSGGWIDYEHTLNFNTLND